MKAKILSICLLLIYATSAFAQGEIIFANRNLRLASGEVYHAPIWIDLNVNGTLEAGEGIGSYAAAIGQTASLGLFLRDGSTPLATALFRTDDNGQFLGAPSSQSVTVPGFLPGENAPLTLKAWVGPSYEAAAIRASWNLTSQPLGGTPREGLPILTPTVSDWGDPLTDAGFSLNAPPGPVAGTDTMIRSTLSNAQLPIETILSNDSNPGGGPVTFVRADVVSNGGAAINFIDNVIVYYATRPGPDFFYYTIRNNSGGVGRGRVDVIIDDHEGLIVFGNRSVAKASGEGTYDIPIYADADFNGLIDATEGIGTFAMNVHGQPANLGLFLKGNDTPLAVSHFRSDAFGAFLGSPITRTLQSPARGLDRARN